MLDDQALAPVATYGTGWAALGAALLAAAALLPVGVVLATRPTRVRLRLPQRRATRVRQACLRRVDEIEAGLRAGRLTPADASSELSQALRRLAAEWSGTLYPAMTLRGLDGAGAAEPLRETVAALYPAAFGGAATEPDVLAAVGDAREVVRTWNPS